MDITDTKTTSAATPGRRQKYRGHEIVKFDTGSRTLGRETWYEIRHNGAGIGAAATFRIAKAIVDRRLDETPEQAAHREKMIEMLAAQMESKGK